MKVIAVTGNIACGKSLVGAILEDYNCAVIDCDNVAHKILFSKNDISQQIVDICQMYYPHTDIINASIKKGFINRSTLSSLFFTDKELKSSVEKIFHPAIRKEVELFTQEKSTSHNIVFVLIPLLFETNQEDNYSQIWLTYCKPKIQKTRLYSRNSNISKSELDKRINSQIPQGTKIEKSHVLIDNSASIEMTTKQVLYHLEQFE